MKPQDRRKHFRLPIAAEVAEPVEITISSSEKSSPRRNSNGNTPRPLTMPAILANISSGGMALITFGEAATYRSIKTIYLVSDILGLRRARIEGRVVHLRSRESVHILGVRFTSLTKEVRQRINHVIDDFTDCETRISLHLPEVCVGNACHYFGLCKKSQKLSA